MKIGFCALSWLDPQDGIDRALLAELKGIGYDGVEIPVVHGTADDYRRLGDLLDRAGLARTALTVMPPGCNPVSDDSAERKAASAHIANVLDLAHILGAKMLVGPIHQTLGVFTGEPPSAIEFVRLAAFHHEAGNIAVGYGMRLAVEPMNRFECHVLTRMDDLARHLEAVGHPAVTALYDTFHANIEEADPVGALERNLHLVGHVHISENDRGIPGTGHVPWAATFAGLKRGGYDGWLTVEAFGRAVPEFAAVARVWRDPPGDLRTLCRRSYRHIRAGWDNA